MTTRPKPRDLKPQEIMEALGLLSADDKELAEIWKMTRRQAQNRARKLMGDEWVDRWLKMNRE